MPARDHYQQRTGVVQFCSRRYCDNPPLVQGPVPGRT
jgi:hypothetical protein